MDYRVELEQREEAYRGFFRMVRYRLRHSLFAGGLGRPIERERLEGWEAAFVLLYDPRRDQVVLVEQFRIGALEEGRRAWLLEPVGGLIEAGEAPETVARREALEEAGCRIGAIESVGCFYVNPGATRDRVHFFCGEVDAGAADGIHGLADEGEDIRVAVLASDAAIAELYSGRIDSANAIVAMQWLALNRARLQREWARVGRS